MKVKNIRKLAQFYSAYFQKKKIPKKRMPNALHYQHLANKNTFALPHCHSMLDKIPKFLDQEKYGKANRWLGWIQACLLWQGHFTLNELKEHNKGNVAYKDKDRG